MLAMETQPGRQARAAINAAEIARRRRTPGSACENERRRKE